MSTTLIALTTTAIATVFAGCACFLTFGAFIVALAFVAALCIAAVATIVAITPAAATASATATAFVVALATFCAFAFFASAITTLAYVLAGFCLGFGIAAEQALQPPEETAAAFSFGLGFGCCGLGGFGRLGFWQRGWRWRVRQHAFDDRCLTVGGLL